MTCGSCGVQNVEFATTCYSCGQPLGTRLRPPSAGAPPPHRVEIPRPRIPGVGLGLGRLLFFAAVAFFFFREPIRQIVEMLRSAKSEPTEVTSEQSPPSEPAPAAKVQPAPPAPVENPVAEPPTENGFRMTLFQWDFAEGQHEPVHFGDVVKGQSQITGFEVSPDNRIDVTMRFTFRDPRGRILEQSEPSRLDQPVETDTLFSTFDYTIPAKGPAGDYELEIGVDDAVSGRAARFRRTIKAVR